MEAARETLASVTPRTQVDILLFITRVNLKQFKGIIHPTMKIVINYLTSHCPKPDDFLSSVEQKKEVF